MRHHACPLGLRHLKRPKQTKDLNLTLRPEKPRGLRRLKLAMPSLDCFACVALAPEHSRGEFYEACRIQG